MQSECSQNLAECSHNVVGANNIQTQARPREGCGQLVIEQMHHGKLSSLLCWCQIVLLPFLVSNCPRIAPAAFWKSFFLGHPVYSSLYLSGSWRGHLNLFYLGKEWTGRGKAKIINTHPQWLSLAVDDRCPASYRGMRSDSTLGRVETLADYFLFQQNGF